MGEAFKFENEMISWNPTEHTDQENFMWFFLRAMEWEALPAFLSQPVVPLLFIFVPWYFVLGGVILLVGLWTFVRHSFVIPVISELALFFVRLKWVSVPVAAIYLFYMGHYILGIISLLWTFIAPAVGFIIPGGKTNVIQNMLMKSYGYEGGDV